MSVVHVRSCNTCPWLRPNGHCGVWGRPLVSVTAKEGRPFIMFTGGGGGKPPAWCPLRDTPMTIVLEDDR